METHRLVLKLPTGCVHSESRYTCSTGRAEQAWDGQNSLMSGHIHGSELHADGDNSEK